MSLNGLNTLNITNWHKRRGRVIQDGQCCRALTKLGAGTLVLTGNNSYTGQTNILGGVLSIQNSSALGSNNSQLSPTTTANASLLNGTAINPAAVAGTPGAPTMVAATSNGGGTLVGTGATLQMVGGLFLSEALALNGGTLESLAGTSNWAGPISLNAPSNILADVGQPR